VTLEHVGSQVFAKNQALDGVASRDFSELRRDFPQARKARDASMMPEQRQENDHRDRNPQQPQQCSSAEPHVVLLKLMTRQQRGSGDSVPSGQ
jgi:hypothetical protein